MSDVAMADNLDQPDLSALQASPIQKRKRDSEGSPDPMERVKRAAPAANMGTGEYMDPGVDSHANGVSVEDFNALQQAAAGEHNMGEHPAVADHQHQQQPHQHQHQQHHQQHQHQQPQQQQTQHQNDQQPHIPEHNEGDQHPQGQSFPSTPPPQQPQEQHVTEHAQGEEHAESQDHGSATSTAQAALGMYPTIHVPASTEEQFAAQIAAEEQQNHENSMNPDGTPIDGIIDDSVGPNGTPGGHRFSTSTASLPKPTVGSEEWHKMRKDNHKEVERRRRETINEGINELAKIVPGCEKNKGSILQRAVHFISQLKENEQQNIEKWTLEKLLTEQAITELSSSNEKLKQECERLYRELETWKRVAQNAGLEPPQPTKDEPAPPGAPPAAGGTPQAADTTAAETTGAEETAAS